MEKKRKSNEDAEYLRNKIRKLESKLIQKSRRRIRILDSSESDNDDIVPPGSPPPGPSSLHSSHRNSSPQRSLRSASPRPRSVSPSRYPASPQPGPSSAPDQPIRFADPVTPSTEEIEDMELDENILNLLGDAPKPDTPLGKAIHKDVASRWQEILNRGLQKEIKDQLPQEYLVSRNCDLLVPPILNLEAKAALPDALVKRDSSLMLRQKQIGLALSALAQATDCLIKEKSSPNVLKSISDACRILCDSHFTETKMRRNFVISAINTNLKDALINTERDKYLFGDNVSEKLKAAQNIQRSGNTLKNTQRSYNTFNKANFTFKNKNQRGSLNFRTLHRNTSNQSRSDAGRPRPAQSASRYNTRYRRKERSRTPPRKKQRR